MLTDGFGSTTKSLRTLFPGARLGFYLRPTLIKLPPQRAAIASPGRPALHAKFHTLLSRVRQRKSLRVVALAQRLRHVADHVAYTAGVAQGERVRRWLQEKKAGWYGVLAAPRMPVTSTLVDQAHNAIERKWFAMKGFHHPGGSQQAFLTGLAHLCNLVPAEREARLVILRPEVLHTARATDIPARQACADVLERRGTSPRLDRNAVIFLAARSA